MYNEYIRGLGNEYIHNPPPEFNWEEYRRGQADAAADAELRKSHRQRKTGHPAGTGSNIFIELTILVFILATIGTTLALVIINYWKIILPAAFIGAGGYLGYLLWKKKTPPG